MTITNAIGIVCRAAESNANGSDRALEILEAVKVVRGLDDVDFTSLNQNHTCIFAGHSGACIFCGASHDAR